MAKVVGKGAPKGCKMKVMNPDSMAGGKSHMKTSGRRTGKTKKV